MKRHKPPLNALPAGPCFATVALCLAGMSAFGGTIVPDLSDASAIYSSTSPAVTAANGYPAPTLANGLTLAARFTPDATDIANSANGAVAVIETGGTTSGTGLWIINGSLWFSGSSGSATAIPTSNLDLDGSDKAIGVQLGSLTAGVQVDIFASLDSAHNKLLISQNSSVLSYTLVNVGSAWNWNGNSSVGFGIADPTVVNGNFGFRGGLADLTAGSSLFSGNSAMSLDGSVALGQIFNNVSAVPEPGMPGMIGMGLLMFMGWRRWAKAR